MISGDKFDQELLKKIKQDKLEPKARWRFLAKNYTIWLLGILAVLLGAVTSSMIIYLSVSNEPRFVSSLGEFLLVAVPIFWLLCLSLFVWLIYINFKNTKHGYRYPMWLVMVLAVAASLLLGLGFHSLGWNSRFDDMLVKRAPKYYGMVNPGVKFWSEAERGRLSGMIMEQVDKMEFLVEDIDRHQWILDTSQARIAPGAIVEVGRPVRVVGKLTEGNHFKAKEILPIMGGREMFRGREPRPRLPGGSVTTTDFCRPLSGVDKNLKTTFDRYPEAKQSFEQDLLSDKGKMQQLIQADPCLLPYLESMGVSPDILEQFK